MKLVLKLLFGIVLGTLIGLYLPTGLVRILITVQSIFGDFIGFAIPFIILLYITHGIAGLGHQSGRTVGLTVTMTYIFTVAAGLLAFIIGSNVLPLVAHSRTAVSAAENLSPYFSLTIDPIMSVITALVTAFVFGIGISKST